MNKVLILKVLLVFYLLITSFGCDQKDKLNSKSNQFRILESKAKDKFMAGDYSRAHMLYSELIQIDSTNGEYYYNRAKSYVNVDSINLAVKDYIISTKLKYRVYDSYYNLGLLNMIALQNDSLALIYFDEALEIKPNSQEVKDMIEIILENKGHK